jgi:hypothetical protein
MLANHMNAPSSGYGGMGAPAGVFGGGYGGMGAPVGVFGGGIRGMGAPAGVFEGGMGSMAGMAGMGLGGYGGTSVPMGSMAGMGAPAGDSWPPWSLQYLLQVMKPMEKKQKNGDDNNYEDVE